MARRTAPNVFGLYPTMFRSNMLAAVGVAPATLREDSALEKLKESLHVLDEMDAGQSRAFYDVVNELLDAAPVQEDSDEPTETYEAYQPCEVVVLTPSL